MDVKSSTSGHLYSAALDVARPGGGLTLASDPDARAEGFADSISDAAAETVRTIRNGEETTQAMLAGKADAHSVVEALAAAEMALEMAVAVRNKVVEAYQEILRMPV